MTEKEKNGNIPSNQENLKKQKKINKKNILIGLAIKNAINTKKKLLKFFSGKI